MGAEETLRRAFYADVKPISGAWRQSKSLPLDPLQALQQSDEIARQASGPRVAPRGEVAGGGYA